MCLLDFSLLFFICLLFFFRMLSRVFLMIWTIYCFNITSIYQSQLIVILTTPSSEKQITTPEELIEADIPFGFSRSFEVNHWIFKIFFILTMVVICWSFIWILSSNPQIKTTKNLWNFNKTFPTDFLQKRRKKDLLFLYPKRSVYVTCIYS